MGIQAFSHSSRSQSVIMLHVFFHSVIDNDLNLTPATRPDIRNNWTTILFSDKEFASQI
jgi:hypothetical protein